MTKAEHYHRYDRGDHNELHGHMYRWLKANPTATYDDYVKYAKSLGIIYYNEEAFKTEYSR